jgi:hypothetical protein
VLAKLLQVDGPGSGLSADTLDGIDAATFLGRFTAIETRLDDAEEPVTVLGVTAGVTGSVVSGSEIGLPAARRICVEAFGAGARVCSYTDVADAITNELNGVAGTAWAPRDGLVGSSNCDGMMSETGTASVISFGPTAASLTSATCDTTHPLLCCRGYR